MATATPRVVCLRFFSSEQNNGLVLIKLPLDRWMLVVPQEQLADTWTHLAGTLQPVGRNRWTLASIDAGEPVLTAETMEQVIPQMLNMQAIDALSFKKGCYPGQEIVASDGIRALAVVKEAVDPAQLEIEGVGKVTAISLELPYQLADITAGSSAE